jgi:oligoendopeptidase F
MKHLKPFLLFEGLEDNQKSFENSLETIDKISKEILTSKNFKERLAIMHKEKPELAKSFKGYYDFATKAQKMIKDVKRQGLSKNVEMANKQVKALNDLTGTLEEAFDNMKTLIKKTESAFTKNEGLGNIIGNALRNVLTGKWIINLVKSVKSNLVDSYNDIGSVQDMFDLKDY